MTGKWRLLLSAVVCLVAIGSAFHFLVMERHGLPDSGIRVVEQGNDEGGRDWVIRLYQSDRRHHWQVSGKGYAVAIDRLGKDSFSLDITYGSGCAWTKAPPWWLPSVQARAGPVTPGLLLIG